MNQIETMFGIGDVVFRISRTSRKDFVTCPKCSGRTFHIMDNGEKKGCDCSYRYDHPGRIVVWTPTAWMIDDRAYKIRSIEAKTDSYGKKEVRYPTFDSLENCSGTMWKEEDCFATEEEALQECSRRNQKEQAEKAEAEKAEIEKKKSKEKVRG